MKDDIHERTFGNFIDDALELVLLGTVDRVDKDLGIGTISIYRVNKMIRIDIKPKEL